MAHFAAPWWAIAAAIRSAASSRAARASARSPRSPAAAGSIASSSRGTTTPIVSGVSP